MVLPLQLQTRLPQEETKIHLGVMLTNAVMRTCAEHEVVLCALDLGVAGVVPLGVKDIGVLIDFWVAKSEVRRRDDH